MIPNSITKFNLYTLVYLDYCILGTKKKILEKDESPIDTILNEDNIIIIEEKRYPDKSYYNLLIQKE